MHPATSGSGGLFDLGITWEGPGQEHEEQSSVGKMRGIYSCLETKTCHSYNIVLKQMGHKVNGA